MMQRKSVIGTASFFLVLFLIIGYFALAADISGQDNPLVPLDYLESLGPAIDERIDRAVEEKMAELLQSQADLESEIREELQALIQSGGLDAATLAQDEAFVGQIVAALGETQNLSGNAKRIDIPEGGTLSLPMGSSVMLRSGGATVVEGSPGLIDSTIAGTLNAGGALQVSHFYTVTVDGGRQIRAGSEGAVVIVWGEYSLD